MDFAARTILAFRALQNALRTSQVPQRLDYFFPDSMQELGPAGIAEYKDKEWQKKFLGILASRGALLTNGHQYAVKNRFFIENLIKGSRREGAEMLMPAHFLEMVWAASGGQSGGWKEALKAHGRLRAVEEPVPTSTPRPASPEPMPEPELVPEERQMEPVTTDEEQVPPPEEPLAILLRVEQMVSALLTIEEKIAENIIYVRDRGDKLHERFKSLNERITVLEGKLQLPPPVEDISPELKEGLQSVVASVNSVETAVTSMKDEVQQVVQSAMSQKASDRIAQIQSSLDKIASEFGALRELALDTFAESGR